jgi:hypothetical protein
MPPESSAHSRALKELVLTVLGTLLVVLAVNGIVFWYLRDHTPNRGYQLVRKKWEMLLQMEHPVDWLILGDSSCAQGVVPSVFNELLGVTSVNLCTVADALAVNDAWMLETYLKRFGPPGNVVLVHVYDSWEREPSQEVVAKIPLPLGYWGRLTPPITLSPRGIVRVLVRRYAPLYAENISLSTLLLPPFGASARDVVMDEAGFTARYQANPANVEFDAGLHLETVQSHTFTLSRPNREALERIAALAEQHQFTVYLANSPLYERLYHQQAFQKYFAQIEGSLAALTAGSSRVHRIFKVPMTFAKDQLEHVDHVIYPAACAYTKRLVSEILTVQGSGVQLIRVTSKPNSRHVSTAVQP